MGAILFSICYLCVVGVTHFLNIKNAREENESCMVIDPRIEGEE